MTRSMYWRPGMNMIEPWVALASTNLGHLMSFSGMDAERALAVVRRWQVLAALGRELDPHRVCVGAVVVGPDGALSREWGVPPIPGAPRWVPITRLYRPAACSECGEPRWPGCWVAVVGGGCARCLPAVELADPRMWPVEPPAPAELAAVEVRSPTVPKALRPRQPGRAAPFSAPRRGGSSYQRGTG